MFIITSNFTWQNSKMKLSLPTEVQTPTCPVIADMSVLKTIGNTPLIKIKKYRQRVRWRYYICQS